MDLSSWETLGAASGAGASLIAKAATQLQQMTNSLTGGQDDSLTQSGEQNNVIPFSKDGTNEKVFILGRKFFSREDFHVLKREIRSRLWFSYRKDFPAIGESGMTSDRGWGCMLRCGQMVVAECLQRLHLGRDFCWSPSEASEQYLDILPLFDDDRSALYSVHQLSMVSSDHRPIGTWFGPNAVAQAIKKMAAFDHHQRLNVFVALNNTLILSDVMASSTANNSVWKPLLLFVPVRLGIQEINPTYCASLKACFELEQCAGVIGGRPNHALYFLGYTCDDLICLDPHVTQTAASVGSKSSPDEEEADSTYHTDQFYRWHMDQLDPSISLCFFCPTEMSFHDLTKRLRDDTLNAAKSAAGHAMFEIYDKPLEDNLESLGAAGGNIENFNTSDDEFELV